MAKKSGKSTKSTKSSNRSSTRRTTSGSTRRSKRGSNPIRRTIISLVALGLLFGLGYLVQQGYIDPDTVGLSEVTEVLEETAGDLAEETGLGGGETGGPVLGGGDKTSVPVQTSDGDLHVFFTTPSLVYPDRPENRTPPPHFQALLADIDAAQQSVDFAVFEYDLEPLADALVRAAERGVQVRLALDEEHLEEDEEMALWAGEVEAAGIPIAWEDSTAFLHSKYAIIDTRIVWMGSWNASNNDTYRNNNNLIRFTIPAIVENYSTEFNQMFGGAFGNDKVAQTPNPVINLDGMQLENYFSPREDVDDRIVALLNEAQRSIHFLAFSYTSDPIAEAMQARHRAGVPVRGVFEKRNATGTGAEYERLLETGMDVLRDGNCYTMHHKFIVIDEAIVITGSYNFSARAEDTNDENLVIIHDPGIAAQYMEEFQRVYAQAAAQPACGG